MTQATVHANVTVLEKLYSDFSKNDFKAFLAGCPEQITFQIPGKSKISGKFTQANFILGFATRLVELSGGTFQTEVHDILASDRHATVLASNKITRNGKTIELRTVHVWRIENGTPVAWYEYPRDLHAFEAIWS